MDRRAEGVKALQRHFACTRCGACCNRAPELELGEAADFADTFVLQLLMRIYSLPRSVADYASELPREQSNAEYFESKRLLAVFAAASWPAKVRRGDRTVDYVQYLSLSVLPLDLGLGSCTALNGTSCAIYDKRPLSCRSVPLHYSRPTAAAARDLDAFVATPGFLCDSGPSALLVIAEAGLVDPAMIAARSDAAARAQTDQRWKAAIVKAMKAGQHGLPSPREVEAQATRGALSASMLGAWRIGLAAPEAKRLLEQQCQLVERELQQGRSNAGAAGTMREILSEYRTALAG